MKITISIDPGVHGSGLAVFADSTLVHAAYVKGLGGQAHPLLEPVDGVERFIREADFSRLETVIIERPKIYDSAQQKGDQRDLADLLIVVGGLLLCAARFARAVIVVEPWQWKGQMPKDVCAARIEKHLSDEERGAIDWPTAKSLSHNVYDGIGIGLWQVGRMGK